MTTPVEDALEWLTAYYEQSASVATRYKTPEFCTKVLRPLVKLVPYVPIQRKLIHLAGTDKPLPKTLVMSPTKITSYTWESDLDELVDIVDSVGLDGYDNCGIFVPPSSPALFQLFNTSWLVKKVVPVIRREVKQGNVDENIFDDFENTVSDYQWQKECVCFFKSPASLTLVKPLLP